MNVAVLGGAGYAAGELLRLLLQHPKVTGLLVTSRSQAGKPIAEAHPGLAPLTDLRFSDLGAGQAARNQDVVFLALEHGQSTTVAPEIFAVDPHLVVDLAADFRIRDPGLYQRFYGIHQAAELLPRFRYGLADVLGPDLRDARAIAVPGCFATAAQLALYPVARAGLEVTPTLFAVTGSSGAGVQLKATTHHPSRAHNLFAYSPLAHRHEAEILQSWREWSGRPTASARLLTHAGPFVRGIYLTLHAYLPPEAGSDSLANPAELFRETYAGRSFVRVLDSPPELTHAVGTNYALVHALTSPEGGELQVSVAIDNLIKGAAGQAIQAMNLALGIDECTGLMAQAILPC
jgi:[amino group carrier protein]-6-phospho-L-2-aminoadipate/5-phospho-L-glutamate reductase